MILAQQENHKDIGNRECSGQVILEGLNTRLIQLMAKHKQSKRTKEKQLEEMKDTVNISLLK